MPRVRVWHAVDFCILRLTFIDRHPMNPIVKLRELLSAEPFRPFILCLSDGRRLPVYHPDFLLISPSGRIIWEGETEEEFAMAMPFHVTGVEDAPRRRRKRAA